MSLVSGVELDPVDGGSAVAVAGSVPAWLHVVIAWSLALICVVFIGVLALMRVPIPTPLIVVAGATIGGALGLTSPLALGA